MLSNQLKQPLRLKLAVGLWQKSCAPNQKNPFVGLKNPANLVGNSIIQSLCGVLGIIQPRVRETATITLVITTYLYNLSEPPTKVKKHWRGLR